MEHTQPEPNPPAVLAIIRHDGWTGEKMAIFCETLAETAVVAEACEAARMGISGAYAARRRDPVFAAAWDAALSIARERLADTLLARSMEGNVEQLYRDGELVGERHVLDNRLGLAILRRLDRVAETGLALHSNPPAFGPARTVGTASTGGTPAVRAEPFDWEMMVGALRTDDHAAVARALALRQGNEVEEVEDPLNRPPSCDLDDQSDRCWWDECEGCWMTDFPPPPGFAGYESRGYDDLEEAQDEPYRRECTPEEVAILEGERARAHEVARGEDEERRDAWFALLKADAEAAEAGEQDADA